MDSLGHYTLTEHIGADRLTETYRATDTAAGRTVTVRILRPEIAVDAARRDALLATARAALPLSHPNIATLFEVGEEKGNPFFVFEHTPGETLRAAVAGSPLNVRRAADLGAQIADGLAEAHGHGVVHGALGADTVILTQKGRVKLVGFGLPSIPPGDAIPTDPSLSADDVACMAPERVLGAAGDARADIFSLGGVLFEMLTGRSPFVAATVSDTMVAILSRTPPPPSHSNAAVPDALDRVVERCLVKSVEGRIDSAAALAAALRDIEATIEAEEPADIVPALPGRAARRRGGWLIVVLVLVCLVGLALAAVAVFQ